MKTIIIINAAMMNKEVKELVTKAREIISSSPSLLNGIENKTENEAFLFHLDNALDLFKERAYWKRRKEEETAYMCPSCGHLTLKKKKSTTPIKCEACRDTGGIGDPPEMVNTREEWHSTSFGTALKKAYQECEKDTAEARAEYESTRNIYNREFYEKMTALNNVREYWEEKEGKEGNERK